MSGAIWNSVVDWGRGVVQGWNEFWFRPADPTLLGVIRLLTGLMLVYTHAVWGLELEAFFGPDAWLSAEAVGELQAAQTVFSYWWWIPAGAIRPAHFAALAVLALFALGVATRVTSVLSLLIAISYAHRTPAALFGLDQINVMLTLYCAIGPSGAAVSIDRLIARFRRVKGQFSCDGVAAVDQREPPASAASGGCAPQTPLRSQPPPRRSSSLRPHPSVGANLSLRLIQVHMCVIYFFAGVSKLQGTAWWNGEAMWLAFANLEYQSMDMTWLARHPWLIHLMSHVTIAWEISFAALIWRPSWRPVMLIGGTLMHVGIGACLGMWTFGLIMLVGCASFLPQSLVRGLVEGLFGARAGGTLIFDGACPVCRRAAARWKAFDIADRLTLADCRLVDPAALVSPLGEEECLRDLHLVTEDRRCLTGLAARQTLLWMLPPLWPIASATALPGFRQLSGFLFERVRHRAIARGTCGASLAEWRDLPKPAPLTRQASSAASRAPGAHEPARGS